MTVITNSLMICVVLTEQLFIFKHCVTITTLFIRRYVADVALVIFYIMGVVMSFKFVFCFKLSNNVAAETKPTTFTLFK